MKRYDLTDFQWSMIEPLLPNEPRGIPRVDDRRVLNGIMWVLRSGAPWRDLPERYGPSLQGAPPIGPLPVTKTNHSAQPLMHMAPVARVCHQMLRLGLGRGNG